MTKVLFVSSGNNKIGPDPIIHNQADSLSCEGLQITHFYILGKGFKGYLKNVNNLRKFIKNDNFDLIHAHYSMSAFVASLSGANPLIVSLMGSDVKSDKLFKFFINFFKLFFWSKTIVKSKDMQSSSGLSNLHIIPNGVDLNKFKPENQLECKKKINWDLNKKQILFAANPNRYEKNYALAKKSFDYIHDINCELKVLDNISNDQMSIYYNAADLVLLTSRWEGSPNVIKEAMACNRPVLCTNVGDVANLFKNVSGCDLISENANEISNKIKFYLDNFHLSDGRSEIKLLKLDSKSVSNKLIKLYSETINI